MVTATLVQLDLMNTQTMKTRTHARTHTHTQSRPASAKLPKTSVEDSPPCVLEWLLHIHNIPTPPFAHCALTTELIWLLKKKEGCVNMDDVTWRH